MMPRASGHSASGRSIWAWCLPGNLAGSGRARPIPVGSCGRRGAANPHRVTSTMGTDSDDFRQPAAAESARMVERAKPGNVLDCPTSLCLKEPGDATSALYRIAVLPWVWLIIAALTFLAGVVYGVLILTPMVDLTIWSAGLTAALVVGGVVLIVMGIGVGNGVFEGTLAARLGGRLNDLEARVHQRYPFCVEDPRTYKKQKVVSEDYATGGVDKAGRGLLLEGLKYRYVIRPRDVTGVVQDGDYLLITYAVGDQPLTLAVNVPAGDDEKEKKALAEIKAALMH